ncbi:E3 ubiquitin-protein ligase tom1 [Savitreella phatthalungensis]
MRITKKPHSGGRRIIEPPPAVDAFMKQALEADNDNLPILLRSFHTWHYPKGDLFQWVAVLNKLDEILEDLCGQYNLRKGTQSKPFTGQHRELLLSLLSFTVFLLDHCANRTLYNSANFIDELLTTTDDEVLEATLRVTLRLAQRWGQQRSGRAQFGINTDKLLSISSCLHYGTRDRARVPVSMLDFMDAAIDVDDAEHKDWHSTFFWFYRAADFAEAPPAAASSKAIDYFSIKTPARRPDAGTSTAPTTPVVARTRTTASVQTPATPVTPGDPLSHSLHSQQAQPDRAAEGMSVWEVRPNVIQSPFLGDALRDAVQGSDIHETRHFDLLQALRFARASFTVESRQRLVVIRLLAVASVASICSDYTLSSRVLSNEEQLLSQLAQLVNPDASDVPQSIGVAAFYALDAIARHGSELNEVLTLFGAGVSHGLLMRIVQRTAQSLDDKDPAQVHPEFVEALMNHLHYLTTTNTAGSMLCAAGLVQILVALIGNHSRLALRALVKSLTLLDHLLYGFQQSFAIFISAGGLQQLVDRIEVEVKLDLDEAAEFVKANPQTNVDYRMSHERFSLLKTMLKFLIHMMQGAGTTDGLRNLIETSLLSSLKLIFEHSDIFGSSVFANATNIMATFIHNEPTSYQILHEAKVTEVFCAAITKNILPASDTLSAIPNAIGAICLHQQGMQLVNDTKPIPRFFDIFVSPPHCEVLRDSDVASQLGNAVDELMRHHPPLQEQILQSIKVMLERVATVGEASSAPEGRSCKFLPVTNPNESTDVSMADASQSVPSLNGPQVVDLVQVASRFLEGLFQNAAHIRDLIGLGLVQNLINFYNLTSLPYDFARTKAALSLSHVLRMVSEVAAKDIVEIVLNMLDNTLGSLRGLLEYNGGPDGNGRGFFAPFLELDSDSEVANMVATNMRRLHSIAVLLSDLYAIPVFSHGRSLSTFTQYFASSETAGKLLESLGQMERQLIWQDILLSESVPHEWIVATQPDDDPAETINEAATAEREKDLSAETLRSPRYRNVKMLRFFLCQTPPCTSPFFQGLLKMVIGRRQMEPQQRGLSLRIAEQIARVLIGHLEFNRNVQPPMSRSQRLMLWLMLLTEVQKVLFDDGGMSPNTTGVLMFFEDGIDLMLKMLDDLWQELLAQTDDSHADDESAKLTGDIKFILHMLQQLTSYKSVCSAPQAIAMTSKDRERERPGYFNPTEFLLILRRRTFPVVAKIWQHADVGKLSTASLKNLIVIITQCISKDTELDSQPRDPIFGVFSSSSLLGGAPILRTGTQQETNITQLVDLGYSRQTAIDALGRSHGSVQTAMDYLMSHPELGTTGTGPAPSSSSSGPSASGSAGRTTTSGETSGEVARDDAIKIDDGQSDEYHQLVESTRHDTITRAIDLLAQHNPIVFELSDLIQAATHSSDDQSFVAEGVALLSAALTSMKEERYDKSKWEHLGAVCHLFAKLAHEPAFIRKCPDDLAETFDIVLDLLDLGNDEEGAEVIQQAQPPPWLSSCCLLIDAILCDASEPHAIVIDKAGIVVSRMADFCQLEENAKAKLFDIVLANLKYKFVDGSWVYSILRLLNRLTQDHRLAAQLVSRNALRDLFDMMRRNLTDLNTNTRSALILLLRHVCESDEVLAKLMQHEIDRRLSVKPHPTDIVSFVKQNHDIALRNPKLFVDAVSNQCALPAYNPQTSVQSIALRKGASDEQQDDQSSLDNPTLVPAGVMYFLVFELFAGDKDFHQEEMQQKAAVLEAQARDGADAAKQTFKEADHPEFMYRHLLLTCCAELLASYNSAKLEFIDFSRRSQAGEAITSLKNRSAAVNLFVTHFIPLGTLPTGGEDIATAKRVATCTWAARCIQALCSSATIGGSSRSSSANNSSNKDDLGESDGVLAHARRTVIDAISKGFRDAASSADTAWMRYSRITALAELCSRLFLSDLQAGLSGETTSSPATDTPGARQVAKLMLEKNFVSILTSAMSEIDLHHPIARKTIRAILKPLKHLTKLGIQLSEAGTLERPLIGQPDPQDISFDSEMDENNVLGPDSDEDDDDDDDDDQDREETPDLYRNSALGMFGGDMQEDEEEGSYDEDEEEDMYDDEMEIYDEEGSDTGSAISDEDMAMDGEGGGEDVLEFMVDHGHHHDHDDSEEEEEDVDDEDDDGLEHDMDESGSNSETDSDDEGDSDDGSELSGNELVIEADEIEFDDSVDEEGDEGESEWEDEEDDGEADDPNTVTIDAAAPFLRRFSRGRLNPDDAAETISIPVNGSRASPLIVPGDGDDDEDEDGEGTDADEYGDIEEVFMQDGDYSQVEEDDDEAWEGWEIEEEAPVVRSNRQLTSRTWSTHIPTMRTTDLRYLRQGAGPRSIRGPPPDTFNHPLLVAGGQDDPTTPSRDLRGDNFSDWVESIESLIGGGAVSIISDMMQRIPGGRGGRNPPQIRVAVSGEGVPAGLPPSLGRLIERANAGQRNPLATPTDGILPSGGAAAPTGETPTDPAKATNFKIYPTHQRWADEASMLHGNFVTERALRIVNHILHAMVPTAAKEAEARQREVDEAARIEAEAREKALEVQRELEAKLQAEQQAAEEARLAAEAEQRELQRSAERDTISQEGMDGIQPDSEVEDIIQTTSNDSPQYISIRGQQVNITGLGIDSEFLEALPDEMREEVLTQHIRERRAAANESQEGAAVELSPEFLEALPAEIRAELLQQEAVDRRRRERLARQAGSRAASGQTGPAEIDPASFLASLDPALRESVLLEQDDDFLDQLPAEMLMEISRGRLSLQGSNIAPLRRRNESARANAEDQETNDRGTGTSADQQAREAQPQSDQTPKQRREIVQLLDKTGVASLIRLLFLPAQTSRGYLNEVLANLCENRSSRAEIVNQLLIILQDGTIDLSAAERCFTALTRRTKAGVQPTSAVPETPAKQAKRLPLSHNPQTPAQQQSQPKTTVPFLTGEHLPNVVTQQCLQVLSHLISHNHQLATYFLSEHETLAAKRQLKARAPAGTAATDDQSASSRFPINVLIGLLQRDSLLNSAQALESLSQLLSTITRPLVVLIKRQRQQAATASETQTASGDQMQTDSIEGDAPSSSKGSAQIAPKKRSPVPPHLTAENLGLVVKILTANECSSRTFQYTLATMQHLTALSGAKESMAEELVSQARAFSQDLGRDLQTLRQHIIDAMAAGVEVSVQALAPFSSASSHQTKLLRILKSIDYLYDDKRTAAQGTPANQDEVEASHMFFGPMWHELGEVLSQLQSASTVSTATMLLPLIESLMVVCKNTIPQEARGLPSASRQATPAVDGTSQLFFDFTEEHKKVLNQMVRNNPSLMSGSFALLVRNPKVLDFDNKRNYFVRRLRDKNAGAREAQNYPPLSLNVRREMVFLDSYQKLYFKNGDEIKYSKLNIRFAGEEGVDAGGVTREWFQVLAKQMFDPNYALFVPVNSDRNTYHPNKLSGINPEHLSFFKFVGRIVGKALYDGRLLDCHFSRPVYRKMLGKNVSLKDMETLDLEYYKSLRWMLDNDITDVITETFSVDTDDFGEQKTIDLVPSGREIAVTEENKHDYVAKVTEYRLLDSVREQLDHFMQGFSDIIPGDLVAIFTEQEIELLISGLPDIDADDWRNNTEYQNYTASAAQIQWFWRCVRGMDDEERARLLQFCTGSARLPIEGFAHLEGMHGVQRFNIHRAYGQANRLPQSHTCFNQLDLPEYESYEQLKQALMTAISEGNEGFGFA